MMEQTCIHVTNITKYECEGSVENNDIVEYNTNTR
jgi:hypothetical protein